MQIHHVGYYVTDINDAVADFQKLGYAVSTPRILDEARKIFIQFMELASNENDMGGGRIELVTPAEGCTLFGKAMQRRGSTPYHICYECRNLEEKILELRKNDFILIREPQIAPAIENRRVAFLYSEAIGQIELLEVE